MAKGSPQQAPTQTTTYTPSASEQELLNLALPAIRQFGATPLQRYSGETVAGFTPAQKQGQEQALATASGAQQQTADQAARTSSFLLDPSILSPDSNPYLAQTIQAAQRPLYQNLTEQILPNIRSDFATGGFGGSRQGIAEGLAARGTQQAAGDVGANLANANYQRGQQTLLSALGLAPTVQQTELQPALTTSAVGDVQQNLEQQQLNQAQQNYYLDRFLPFLQAQEILSLSQSVPRGTATATGSVPQQTTGSRVNQALGGAASGAALGTAILPGIGTGIGALGGAVLPFLF